MSRDIFICHASEDKQSIVTPLVNALTKAGISCWVDEGEIIWGDSISQKVNEGLRNSKFIIAIISEVFVKKNWPQREINAALNMEASSGEVIVLPLLVGNETTRKTIIEQYPLLNDKYRLVWENDTTPIVEEAFRRLGKIDEVKQKSTTINKVNEIENPSIPMPKLRKTFTQLDKDKFLKKCFQGIYSYFQNALDLLEKTYSEVETDLEKMNTNDFIAKIYLRGDLRNQCRIWLGGPLISNSIAFSEGLLNLDSKNSFNEAITVEENEDTLSLKLLMGNAWRGERKELYTTQEAAEALWKRFSSSLEY